MMQTFRRTREEQPMLLHGPQSLETALCPFSLVKKGHEDTSHPPRGDGRDHVIRLHEVSEETPDL
jgi:hypothetical protein